MTSRNKYYLSIFGLSGLFFLSVICCLLFFYYLFISFYDNKIFPGVSIAGIEVGGLSEATARQIISNRFNQKISTPIYLSYNQFNYKLDLKPSNPRLDLNQSLDQAYQIGRSSDPIINFQQQLTSLIRGYNVQPNLSYQNGQDLEDQLNKINLSLKRDPQEAQLILDSNILVIPSQDGLGLDTNRLSSEITNFLTLANPISPIIPIQTLHPKFTTQAAQTARWALESVKTDPIYLHYQDTNLTIDQPTLFSLLNVSPQPKLNYNLSLDSQTSDPVDQNLIDPIKLGNFLFDLSSQINQEAQEPRFFLDPNTNRVTDFQPAQEGRRLDIDKTARLITQTLNSPDSRKIQLPVIKTEPKVQTSDINNLGVNELLGQGTSFFSGSINNRIYNLTLAAQKINGVLIPPGEEFSFDKAVGDISQAAGFKPGYSIKGGKTVLDDGGGVCQISTTAFRAALNAGLPITARTAHAYRVHYYEEGGFLPGIDATIYSPYVDFKFKNDTSSYILVQSYVKDEEVFVNLYGTKDGRVATLTKPKILAQTPPPPEVRQDDPTLPKGVIKQVEFPAWGANVEFSRTVTRDGQTIISETWKSNFQPWAAVYLVGTKEG